MGSSRDVFFVQGFLGSFVPCFARFRNWLRFVIFFAVVELLGIVRGVFVAKRGRDGRSPATPAARERGMIRDMTCWSPFLNLNKKALNGL